MKYKKYTYEQFIFEIKVRLEKYFGDEYEVIVEEITRNNSYKVFGFVISKRGTEKYPSASPIIYAQEMYDAYRSGRSLDSIIDMVDRVYRTYFVEDFEDIRKMTAENAERYIYYRLINYEKNKDILKKIPHIRYLDLAITFHYLYSIDADIIQSIRITEKIMNDWNYSLKQLRSIAEKNTPILFPDKIDTIKNVLESFVDKKLEDILSAEELAKRKEMFILTNIKSTNGASTMLYSSKIKEMSELYQQDVFIIPSSIHEVILIPVEKREEGAILKMLVENVNKEHVAEEEILSDNVYIYDKDTGEINILNL